MTVSMLILTLTFMRYDNWAAAARKKKVAKINDGLDFRKRLGTIILTLTRYNNWAAAAGKNDHNFSRRLGMFTRYDNWVAAAL